MATKKGYFWQEKGRKVAKTGKMAKKGCIPPYPHPGPPKFGKKRYARDTGEIGTIKKG